MLGALLPDLWPWLLGALAVAGGLFGFGRVQKAKGKAEVKTEALEDSAKRQEEGREAVGDLRGADRDDLVKRLRDNDGQW
ncbi:MAG: hypothetical protein MRY81_10040 [Donghicola eburneus]|nr:hypothetical protein [Donghicola eburneus]MCI5040012.1 hypothetical protein [Donghicola eburneus]